MIFCTHCGKESEDTDKFCAHCGTPLCGDPEAVAALQNTQDYNKIGGWLYVVGGALFITPFVLAYKIFDSLSLVLNSNFLSVSDQVTGMVPALWFEIVIDAVFILVSVYLIFLFKEKKREFPKYYVWYLWASVVYVLADYVLLASLTTTSSEMREILDTTMSEEAGSLTQVIIGSIIWVLYMNKSKRVAGTFVR